jgi:3-hydroxyisobutyrate dehydrogenase-like beta-hydroxyacid dehydrogenase
VEGFAGALDIGDRPDTAAIIKLLNNQMLLVQAAVIAETIRAGRAAGIDDATLTSTFRESLMMPVGLGNRIDVYFDPGHAGWFTSAQAAKDVTLFLELAECGAPLPVTEAARDAYRQVARDGWMTNDVPPSSSTAAVRRDRDGRGAARNSSGHIRVRRTETRQRSLRRVDWPERTANLDV